MVEYKFSKLFLFTFEIFFTATFFTTALVVFLLSFASLMLIWPWSRRHYRRVTNRLYWMVISHTVFLCEWWSTIKLFIYVDEDVYSKYFGKEHAVILMNHRYEIDYLTLVLLSDKFGISGNLKAYVKDTAKYMPLVGWILYLVEYIFLKRSFANDENTIKQQVADICDNPHPLWLILYPEGTRITAERHLKSRLFERERGLRPLLYHLQPRTKGFLASMPAYKAKFGAIYDTELYIENCRGTVNYLDLYEANTYVAHMYIRRIDVNDIPDGEEKQRMYLLDLYQNKDRSIETFLSKIKEFQSSDGTHIIEPIQLHRNPMVLWNFIFWCFICCYPLFHMFIKSIYLLDFTSFLTVIMAYPVALLLKAIILWTIRLQAVGQFNCCDSCAKVAT